MRRFLYSYAFLLVTLCSCQENIIDMSYRGFDSPVTESTDDYTITYQYKEGVIVLGEEKLKYLEKIEADTILCFLPNTPIDLLPKIGDIISARVTSKTPYGLGNIVLERFEDDGFVKCVTTVTPLDDIFSELAWEFNAYLSDSILSGYTDETGEFIQPSYVYYDEENDSCYLEEAKTRKTIGHKKLLSLPIHPKKDGILRTDFSGSINLGAFVHCSGDIKENTFNFYFQPILNLDAVLKIGAVYDKEGFFQDIDEYSLFKLENIVKGVIQLGPVTLRPYVDIETYLDFFASGAVTFRFDKTFSAKIGYSQAIGGYIDNETSGGDLRDCFSNMTFDGNANLALRCIFDVGCGLYTKRIALSLAPYITHSVSADCRFTDNPNLWRLSPTINFDTNIGATGRLVVDWWGGLKITPELNFIDTNLFHAEAPLLPALEENSIEVEKRDVDGPLTFDAKYQLRGGLLRYFMDIMPSFRVYRGAEEIYHIIDAQEITPGNKISELKYELTGLEHDVSYTGKPSIIFMGNMYDEDGIPFSSTSPTAAITDIVQTGSAHGAFVHNGNDYEYEFKFYVNTEIRGSESCKEWGVYDPNSDDIYNPNELKDGRVTQYWTAFSNNGTATFNKTPYVILKETNDYKFFENHTHTLYYGGVRATNRGNRIHENSGEQIVMQLDSVVYK